MQPGAPGAPLTWVAVLAGGGGDTGVGTGQLAARVSRRSWGRGGLPPAGAGAVTCGWGHGGAERKEEKGGEGEAGAPRQRTGTARRQVKKTFSMCHVAWASGASSPRDATATATVTVTVWGGQPRAPPKAGGTLGEAPPRTRRGAPGATAGGHPGLGHANAHGPGPPGGGAAAASRGDRLPGVAGPHSTCRAAARRSHGRPGAQAAGPPAAGLSPPLLTAAGTQRDLDKVTVAMQRPPPRPHSAWAGSGSRKAPGRAAPEKAGRRRRRSQWARRAGEGGGTQRGSRQPAGARRSGRGGASASGGRRSQWAWRAGARGGASAP